MTTVDVSLTNNEIELLENALDSHRCLGEQVRVKLDLLAASYMNPEEIKDHMKEVNETTRQQKDSLTLLKAKLIHTKDKLLAEEFAKSL